MHKNITCENTKQADFEKKWAENGFKDKQETLIKLLSF